MARFTVKKISDLRYKEFGIVDQAGNVVASHTYSVEDYAQGECDVLNRIAIYQVGDRVRCTTGLRDGDLATIETELISLYPSPYVQYIVRFDAPNRFSSILRVPYEAASLELA